MKEKIVKQLKGLPRKKIHLIPGLISVILPIYGDFDLRRAQLTIESILAQEEVDLEVIVSEQGDKPKLESRIDSKVKYVFHEHNQALDLSDFNPGLIRNQATEIASGEFLYTNDADVIFLHSRYLKESLKLLQSNPNLALYRPSMRRLPLENFKEFWRRFCITNIEESIRSLNFSQQFLATTDNKTRELKVVIRQTEEYTKTFVTSMDNFLRYLKDESLRGREPIIWSENLHCGGNFLRREHFDFVGGYCEEFINWGCEDSDLQWKISKCFTLEFFPHRPELEVLHLDHSKDYFSGEMWKKNEISCATRKERGILAVVREDVENGYKII